MRLVVFAMLYLPDSDDALLRPQEAAEVTRVDTTTLARWARAGKVFCVRAANGHRRYRWGDLRAIHAHAAAEAVSSELEGDVVRLYLQGWSIAKVAETFGREYGQIHRLLIRKRVPLRHGPAPRWGTTWDEVARQLIGSILDGTYRPGTRLPSSNLLALKYGINRGSVVDALQRLDDQGWVRVLDHGTYVRAKRAWPTRERAEG